MDDIEYRLSEYRARPYAVFLRGRKIRWPHFWSKWYEVFNAESHEEREQYVEFVMARNGASCQCRKVNFAMRSRFDLPRGIRWD